MTTTMQTKILAEFEKIADEAGLDPVLSTEWANTGTLRLMDGFETRLGIRYQFNANYCTLSFTGPTVKAWDVPRNATSVEVVLPDRDAMTAHHLTYSDSVRVRAVFGWVRGGLCQEATR